MRLPSDHESAAFSGQGKAQDDSNGGNMNREGWRLGIFLIWQGIGRCIGRRRNFACVALVLALMVAAAPIARAIETPARQAILVDAATGTVLMEKAAEVPMPPASMSKLMTIFMAFEKLKSGALNLDDKLLVSEKAWRMGGSKMFVMVNTRVSVADLLRGIIVQSGNDACIVIAEAISGSEEAFAEDMTRRAREIGLTDSTFRNATGWPDEGHEMSARDIAAIAGRIIREFPQYYGMFAEKNFTYNGIRQGNRNPLLYKNFGADGLKTGHTEVSGYGLVASAERKGRRLIMVINGLGSVRARSSEAARLLDWGFRETHTYKLFQKGDVVARADVWLGTEPNVPLVIERDLNLTLPRKLRRKMVARVIYKGPIPAPLLPGTPVARLVISVPERDPIEVPLVAGAAVKRLGMIGRLGAAVNYLLWGGSR